MDKTRSAELEQIAAEIRDLKASPLYEYRVNQGYSAVVGEGDPYARIMFIGEAPGKKEAQSGRPFVGAAGRILDELLDSVDLQREEVYITNVVKDRPPENRDPNAQELQIYGPFLDRQIEIIQPELIATLGRFATDFVLERFDHEAGGKKIGDLHGKVLEAQAPYGDITIIPFYHPAAALYVPERKETLKDDFQVLKRYL